MPVSWSVVGKKTSKDTVQDLTLYTAKIKYLFEIDSVCSRLSLTILLVCLRLLNKTDIFFRVDFSSRFLLYYMKQLEIIIRKQVKELLIIIKITKKSLIKRNIPQLLNINYRIDEFI